MSRITNDGLTRSGTGCFIAVSIWQQWASKGYWLFFCVSQPSLQTGVLPLEVDCVSTSGVYWCRHILQAESPVLLPYLQKHISTAAAWPSLCTLWSSFAGRTGTLLVVLSNVLILQLWDGLSFQLDFTGERLKVMQSNAESSHTEVELLRDKNTKFIASLARHQETISKLQEVSRPGLSTLLVILRFMFLT